MRNYETFAGGAYVVGFAGSEVERAAQVANTSPTETRLEALVKRELAKVLVRLAKSVDHTVFAPQAAQH